MIMLWIPVNQLYDHTLVTFSLLICDFHEVLALGFTFGNDTFVIIIAAA
jgi:hypothetical protein